MTRTQYFTLKEELKELAQKIRNQKNARKSSAQAFSKFQLKNGTLNDFWKGRMSSSDWLLIRDEHNKLWAEQMRSAFAVEDMAEEFRLKHVVYCLARGRTIKEIEPHNKKGNHLDIIPISRTAKKYGLQWPPAPEKA